MFLLADKKTRLGSKILVTNAYKYKIHGSLSTIHTDYISENDMVFRIAKLSSTKSGIFEITVYQIHQEVPLSELSEGLDKDILYSIFEYRTKYMKDLCNILVAKHKDSFFEYWRTKNFNNWIIKKGGSLIKRDSLEFVTNQFKQDKKLISIQEYKSYVKHGLIQPLDIEYLKRIDDLALFLQELDFETTYNLLKDNLCLHREAYPFLKRVAGPDNCKKLALLFDKKLLYSYDSWWAYLLEDSSLYQKLLIEKLNFRDAKRIKLLLERGVTWESVGLDTNIMSEIMKSM